MLCRFLESRASAFIMVTWKDKHQFGLAVLVVSPPDSLSAPSLLATGAEWEKEKVLTFDSEPTLFSS